MARISQTLVVALLIGAGLGGGCRAAKDYVTSWKSTRFVARDVAASGTPVAPPASASGEPIEIAPRAVVDNSYQQVSTSLESVTGDGDLPDVDLPASSTPGRPGVGGAVSIGWSTGMPF